jgi:hypothetical protein
MCESLLWLHIYHFATQFLFCDPRRGGIWWGIFQPFGFLLGDKKWHKVAKVAFGVIK